MIEKRTKAKAKPEETLGIYEDDDGENTQQTANQPAIKPTKQDKKAQRDKKGMKTKPPITLF